MRIASDVPSNANGWKYCKIYITWVVKEPSQSKVQVFITGTTNQRLVKSVTIKTETGVKHSSPIAVVGITTQSYIQCHCITISNAKVGLNERIKLITKRCVDSPIELWPDNKSMAAGKR